MNAIKYVLGMFEDKKPEPKPEKITKIRKPRKERYSRRV